MSSHSRLTAKAIRDLEHIQKMIAQDTSTDYSRGMYNAFELMWSVLSTSKDPKFINDKQNVMPGNDGVRTLILHFPLGEECARLDKIAQYTDDISNYRCSGGGYKITRMPFDKGDERMEFSNDIMEYTYEYRKDIHGGNK